MLYIKLFIEREKNTGQSAPECPFKHQSVNESTAADIVILFGSESVRIVSAL